MLQVSAHWFACLWALQASIFSESILDSWLGNYGYCEARQPASADALAGASPSDAGYAACPDGWICRSDFPGTACLSDGSLYGVSIYWAIATIVSVGYGDIGATPYNTAEQVNCAFLMSIGGVLWGYVVGTFCGTIANLSPATREFRTNMDDLNTYMRQNRVDMPLRLRLREYFHRTRHLHDASNQNRLLTMMSPMLQSEVVLAVNRRWLSGVWFLARVESEFLVSLTLSLAPMVLAPYELAPAGFLYILSRGVVILGGDLKCRGSTWGEDIILGAIAPGLIRPQNAKAMNYAELYICSWSSMQNAVEGFPQSALQVRRCALRLAMRRQIVKAAAQVVREEKASAKRSGGNDSATAASRRDSGSSSNRSGALSTSFRRAKTIHKMFARSTSASEAQVSLQTQLINMRRANTTGSVLEGADASSSPLTSTDSFGGGGGGGSCGAPAAAGWERRAGAPAPAVTKSCAFKAPARESNSTGTANGGGGGGGGGNGGGKGGAGGGGGGGASSSQQEQIDRMSASLEMLTAAVAQQASVLERVASDVSRMSKSLTPHSASPSGAAPALTA